MKMRNVGAFLASFLLAAAANAASVTLSIDNTVDVDNTTGFVIVSLKSGSSGPGSITLDATGSTLTGFSLTLGTWVARADFHDGTGTPVGAFQESTVTGWSQTSTNSYGTNTVAGAGAEFGFVIATSWSGTITCSGTSCPSPFPQDGWGVPPATETSDVTVFIDTFVDAGNFSGRIEHRVTNGNVGDYTEFYSFSTVPEPGTVGLLSAGLLGLGLFGRRRN